MTFDSAHGLFFAKTASGQLIPVARLTKALFTTSIEVTKNAIVRIEHPRGAVTVVLEAIDPNDPAMHAPPNADPDGGHAVDVGKILN